VNGKPEFRAMDPVKRALAIRDRLCWVCGEQIGRHLAFVVGPMCGINRTTSEPHCHLVCAEWAARNCPFLSRPHMTRREDETINAATYAANGIGMPIVRNPGVTLVWVTRSYSLFRADRGHLINLGPPDRVIWYCKGRLATRDEVDASIATGLPALQELADLQPELNAPAMLAKAVADFQRLLPGRSSAVS